MSVKRLIIIISIFLLVLPLTVQAAPSNYPSLNSNLMAFWDMNGWSGPRLDSARDNHLTDNNTVGKAIGVVENAANFISANSEALSITDKSDLSMGDIDFTISMWVYPVTTSNQWFISKAASAAAADREYAIYYYSNSLRFSVGNGITSNTVTGPALSSSEWSFVVCWHDASSNTINIQVDNGTITDLSYSNGSHDSGGSLYISSSLGASYFSDSHIDAVGIWKRVLTADERAALYNSGNGREYPDFPDLNTPTAIPTATATSSGQCSDCWYTPTPTPTGTLMTSTPVQVPVGTIQAEAPDPIVLPGPDDFGMPTSIPAISFAPPPDPINPDPIPAPSPVNVAITPFPTPEYPDTSISSTVSLSYTTPLSLTASGGITSSEAYTTVNDILDGGYDWIINMTSYSDWLSGEIASIQQTGTFTISSAPEWYAPDLPRPMADIGWTFEEMQTGIDSGDRYPLNNWAWFTGYIASLPIQLVKTLYQIVEFLGPLGLFMTWLLIMLPFVLWLKLFVLIKNIFIGLFNFIIKVIKFFFDLIGFFI